MIRYLRGKFHPQQDGTAIIETDGGIGFLVTIPSNSPLYSHLEGEEVELYTLMTVREDAMSLYGFSSKDELDLFRLLITVNGVGAKAGMAIMSILPVQELKRAIAAENAKVLTQASGVGKRTADRIVLELKDKVEYDVLAAEASEGAAAHGPESMEVRRVAVQGLEALGYSAAEAEAAVNAVEDEDLDVEGYIKAALKYMI